MRAILVMILLAHTTAADSLPRYNARSARQEVVLGGVFLAAGAALALTATVLSVDYGTNRCGDDCMFWPRRMELVPVGLGWGLGALALAGGTTLVVLGRRELSHVQPTITLNSIGVRF